MRLINTKSLLFQEFVGAHPPYAILSHTWGPEEVPFADFYDAEHRTQQAGFHKIQLTCQQARKDGLDWAWIDTCCIDKSSSAELSEAINSMFKWYRESAVCYAYLEDWDEDAWTQTPADSRHQILKKCKWFSRGWTLQEPIAPRKLVFYGQVRSASDWHMFGDKTGLLACLTLTTGIDEHILRGADLASVSVAKRMSWAACRTTTRAEDIAYCLMGIFDVNMPMLYGEGQKAFLRLQEEILKESEDQSLFVWKASPESEAKSPFRGIFADSPAEFVDCADIVPFQSLNTNQTLTVSSNRGVAMNSITYYHEEEVYVLAQIALNCRWGDDPRHVVGLQLMSANSGDQYLRHMPSMLAKMCCTHLEIPRTVYVTKSNHGRQFIPRPDLMQQRSFWVSDLPPGIYKIYIHGNAHQADYRGNEHRVGPCKAHPFCWCSGAIELGVDGEADCILLMLWVNRHAFAPYTHTFDLVRTPIPMAQVASLRASNPLDQANERCITLNRTKLLVRGQPRQLQGFDVFQIDVELSNLDEGDGYTAYTASLARTASWAGKFLRRIVLAISTYASQAQ